MQHSWILSLLNQESFDYSKADWRKYRRLIENNIDDIQISYSIMAIEIAFTKFTELIINARSASVPTKEIQAKTKISPETKRLIQFKNKLRRIWQRTSSLATKQLLKTELNKIQIVIHQMVKKDVNAHWNKQLRKMDKGNKKVWNIAKQIRGKKDTSFNKIKIDGQVAIDDLDRANCLAKIFEKSHKITQNHSQLSSRK